MDGAIPVNGLCRDGDGICAAKGLCIFLDGSYATADLTKLVKESASDFLELLANYWFVLPLLIDRCIIIVIYNTHAINIYIDAYI